MGGKKGPEKNRKYEKDRRDRFNDQFAELQRMLPNFSSSSAKATKTEIIAKTIQYLKDTQTQTHKLESEFESEKTKISELQKKVNGLLQIVKELIKLVHNSNIRFPSIEIDDLQTFQDIFTKNKRELTSASNAKTHQNELKPNETNGEPEFDKETTSSAEQIDTTVKEMLKTSSDVTLDNNNIPVTSTCSETNSSVAVTSSEQSKAIKINSNAFFLPGNNVFAINGVQNGVLNYCYNTPSLLLAKQYTTPTLVLMQNNFSPFKTVQHIAVLQQTQKLIVPKQTISTTKTTFINKKPIPTVRLFKSTPGTKDDTRKTITIKRRRSRRSKGILVKYPKRKPPNKSIKQETGPKKMSDEFKEASSIEESSSKNCSYPIITNESLHLSNEPSVLVNEHSKTPDESEVLAVTPTLPAKRPSLFSGESSSTIRESSLSTDKPLLCTNELSLACSSGEPSLSVEESSLPINRSSLSTSDPLLTTCSSSSSANGSSLCVSKPAISTGKPSVSTDGPSSSMCNAPLLSSGEGLLPMEELSLPNDGPSLSTGSHLSSTCEPSSSANESSLSVPRSALSAGRLSSSMYEPSESACDTSLSACKPSSLTSESSLLACEPLLSIEEPSTATSGPALSSTGNLPSTTCQPSIPTDKPKLSSDVLLPTRSGPLPTKYRPSLPNGGGSSSSISEHASPTSGTSLQTSRLSLPANQSSLFTNGLSTMPVSAPLLPASLSSFTENSEDVDKTYLCADRVLNTPDIQTTGQFIDFFESGSRCMDNVMPTNGSSEFTQSNNVLKGEKPRVDGFETNMYDRPFHSTALNCDLIQPVKEKTSNKDSPRLCDTRAVKKDNHYNQTPSAGDSLLHKYVPGIGKDFSPINTESSVLENMSRGKENSLEKEIISIRSTSKDLNLSLLDDKKHYETSFDEFSNDLFTSLQVPSSGQNTDSMSPTAAFLQSFPLVSSGANVDLLPEHEGAGSSVAAVSTAIMQINSLESPSTMLFSSGKVSNRDNSKATNTIDGADISATFGSYCASSLELDSVSRKEKRDGRKEAAAMPPQAFNFNELANFGNGLSKPQCSGKEVSQNMSFYSATTSASSTFSSYNLFTKYNDIPPPAACSYYSLCSQPFTATSKSTDAVAGDSSGLSWMPPTSYAQDNNVGKDSGVKVRDKCATSAITNTNSLYRSVHSDYSSQLNVQTNVADRPKHKKQKLSNAISSRPLVNWMTAPDLRNEGGGDVSQPTAHVAPVYGLPKDNSMTMANTNTVLPGSEPSNNINFNNSFSGSNNYFLENQSYSEPQVASGKIAYSSSAAAASGATYSWSTSKSSLPALPVDAPINNMIIPSTLPTLVGDLALGSSSSATYNGYDLMSAKKFESEKKKVCRNYCKNTPASNSGTFFSVTQLVDDKGMEKSTKKQSSDVVTCSFDEARTDKCSYLMEHKGGDGAEYRSQKKSYSNSCKDTEDRQQPQQLQQQQQIKCKKDTAKYQVSRCAAPKENKKDTRHYAMQSCQVQSKEANPLSSKNSNYSAESLIGGSNYQNSCSATSTGYFPYENSTNYGASCSTTTTNEYPKKRMDEAGALTNVGYYANTNYVYHNNFQSFNNYSFSNQCYNNYSSQIQPTTGFHKKKEDGFNSGVRQDTTSEWSLSSYNAIGSSEFAGGCQKVDPKYKQTFAQNKYNHGQKNGAIGADVYNKFYQVGHISNGAAATSLTQSKSNCAFPGSTCSFNQTGGQHCLETSCLAPSGYEMKSSRNSGSTGNMNSNTVHSATTLTNFNLSTIFPEINDKHCTPNRVNAVGSEKNDPKYNKNSVDEINYNYLLQPAAETNSDHLFGPSSLQIHNFTDFTGRKALK